MKLFYITNTRLPNDKAHGIQVVKMAEALRKLLGNSFKLVVPNKAQPKDFTSSLQNFYSLSSELPITKLAIPDPMILARYIPVFFETILFPFGVIIFGFAILRFCLTHRSAVFYTRDFYLLPFILLAGVQVYYETHYFPATQLGILLHRLFIPRTSGVIALTGYFQKHFDKNNIKYKKILVSPDATDPAFFKARSRKPNKKIIVGYIGRLSGLGENKGGNILISAFKKAYSTDKNLELLVVGEDQKEKIPGVTFTGTRPYNQMPHYFNLIDIAVIPFPNRPHFRYFMSPLKLFDYMAVGKPIIAPDLPSLREIVSTKNTLFFQPGDMNQLAQAILKLAGDKKFREDMSKANRLLSAKYTWQKRAQKILEFLAWPNSNWGLDKVDERMVY